METSTYSQRILREELARRQHRNPSYSLRALARDLNLPRTTISDVIQGKRRLSKASIERIQKKLVLEASEIERLTKESQSEWFEIKNENSRRTLEDDEFRIISSWYFFAILNLARLPANQARSSWIAARLGLPAATCREALKVLTKLELLRIEDGRMIRTAAPLQTRAEVPSRYVRDQQRQFLEIAAESLDNVPIGEREVSATTMAIVSSRVPKAKKMILKFRRKLADFLTEGGSPDSVYTLGTQLVPTRRYPKS